MQAIGDETNTVGLDGLSERCAKYYKQGTSTSRPLNSLPTICHYSLGSHA